MLRMWMLRPIVDLDAINERQTTIEQLMSRPDVVKEVRTTLRQVKDVPRMLQRLQQTQSCPDIKDFKLITASLTHILQLQSSLQEMSHAGGPQDAGRHGAIPTAVATKKCYDLLSPSC